MNFFYTLQRKTGLRPMSLLIGIGIIIGFLVSFFVRNESVIESLVFRTDKPNLLSMTLHWVLAAGFVGLLFACLTVYFFIGAIERSHGSKTVAVLFGGSLVLSEIAMFATSAILKSPQGLVGPQIALSTIVVFWAFVNPRAQVLLYFVPVPGIVIGLLSFGFLFFGYGAAHPLVGLAAIMPLLASALIAKYDDRIFERERRKSSQVWNVPGRSESDFLAEAEKRKKEREEKERLRKLFERSLIEDPDDKKG